MGNAAPAGKVILSNGAVFTYDQPLTVAELMLEHPREIVVEFQTSIGKKPTPLPADQNLDRKKVYLMLPMRKGKTGPTLLPEEVRRLLEKANSVFKSKALLSYTGFLPLFVRICPGKNEAVSRVDGKRKCSDEGDIHGTKADYFAEALEGRPEILSRQVSGKGWRPSLDTIVEKGVYEKVRHWIL